MTTYQAIIRSYSDSVLSGHSDTDLTPRQRRLVHVMLNVASNDGRAHAVYPPTDATRDDVARAMADSVWIARPFAWAVSTSVPDDVTIAQDRAAEILHNV